MDSSEGDVYEESMSGLPENNCESDHGTYSTWDFIAISFLCREKLDMVDILSCS